MVGCLLRDLLLPDPMNTNTYANPSTYPWWVRIIWRLYPSQHCELPAAPATHQDVLFTNVLVVLPFVDRLRVLISGKLAVRTKTVTENTVGNCVSSTVSYPLRPMSLEQAKREI